jgi:hypothetical protein
MEDEGLMAAPGSNSDEPTDAQLEETDEMSFEWLILGRDELGALHNIDAEETPVTIDGLLWEHGTKILHKPPDKTEHAPAEIYDQYKHMFNTPIDAMFAMLPYTFWEVMAFEMNRYAGQRLESNRRNLIVGYKWTPVSVQELLVFFAILIFYMMYPQTGR